MERKNITRIGAAVSAVFASICCVGPVILAGLGAGAASIAFVKGFERFHIFFIILTFFLLILSFYFSCGKGCKTGNLNGRKKDELPHR